MAWRPLFIGLKPGLSARSSATFFCHSIWRLPAPEQLTGHPHTHPIKLSHVDSSQGHRGQSPTATHTQLSCWLKGPPEPWKPLILA